MKNIKLNDVKFWSSLHFTNKLQKNLDILYKKCGDNFRISYKRHSVPIYFYEEESLNKDNKLYVIKYGVKSTVKDKLYPFKILMCYNVNNIKLEDVNDVYIGNISAIEKGDYIGQKPINGSTIVEMVILLMKRLGVNNVYLNDGAGIRCEGDDDRNIMLSPFKMLEKRRTFYMKFGFMPILTSHMIQECRYKSINTFMKMVDKSIDKIEKLDMKEVHKYVKQMINLINRIYVKDDYNNVVIYRYVPEKYQEGILKKDDNKEKLEEYRSQCMMLEKSMPSSGNFSKWIKSIFYKDCKMYKNLMEVVAPKFGAIYYGKRMYKMKYRRIFNHLYHYNNMNYKLELK
jgi:hypothetical protein